MGDFNINMIVRETDTGREGIVVSIGDHWVKVDFGDKTVEVPKHELEVVNE